MRWLFDLVFAWSGTECVYGLTALQIVISGGPAGSASSVRLRLRGRSLSASVLCSVRS